MKVELRIPRDRSSTRLVFLAALLLAFLLTPWAAVPASAQALSQGKGNLRVMTYNVYEGADLSVAFTAQTPMEFSPTSRPLILPRGPKLSPRESAKHSPHWSAFRRSPNGKPARPTAP